MSTTDPNPQPQPQPQPQVEHGLTYPSTFLPSLRVLTPRPSPHQPIRLLPLDHFKDIHLRSLLSHAPDNVLFPFLHGLEGANQAQNMFFQMSGGSYRNVNANVNGGTAVNGVTVPKFRGLIWVVCEEDLDEYVNSRKAPSASLSPIDVLADHSPQSHPHPHPHPHPNPTSIPLPQNNNNSNNNNNNNNMDTDPSDEDDFYSSDDDDDDSNDDDDEYSMDMDMDMDLDSPDIDINIDDSQTLPFGGVVVAMDVDVGVGGVEGDLEAELMKEGRMHPVHHRTSPGLSPTSSPSPAINIKSSSFLSPPSQTNPAPPTPLQIPSSPSEIDSSNSSSNNNNSHDRRPSNASSLSSTIDTDAETDAFSVSTSATSYAPCSGVENGSVPSSLSLECSNPTVAQSQIQAPPPSPVSSAPSPSSASPEAQSQTQIQQKQTPAPSTPPPLPLLTSTFRPKDLLRTAPAPIITTATTSDNSVDTGGAGGVERIQAGMGGEPEFVPPKVPAGISLRNFGIQVPIYATLSDIVVYSPKGLTRASMALAERFKVAVERKAAERLEKVKSRPRSRDPVLSSATTSSASQPDAKEGEGGGEGVNSAEGLEKKEKGGVEEEGKRDGEEEEEDDDGLIKYNVFVLDATAEEMMEKVPHLMVRLQGPAPTHSSPSSSSQSSSSQIQNNNSNAHTTDHSAQTTGEPRDGVSLEERAKKPNTIDFALREKEEMRDLTRASEIISVLPACYTSLPGSLLASGSLPPSVGSSEVAGGNAERSGPVDFSGTTTASHWDPRIGQVFLGNSNDVPLAPEPLRVTMSRRVANHNHNPLYPQYMDAYSALQLPNPQSPQQAEAGSGEEGKGLGDSDPFAYEATNDPAKGFGYDICVECHEVAPFPSTAHLRAADEHLQMLDALWAAQNGFKGGEIGDEDVGLPIRPPPNANAIIHLPFPSSPPSYASAVPSLLPFVRFLERVLQPVPVSAPARDNHNHNSNNGNSNNASGSNSPGHARRWSSVSALMPSFPSQSYQGLRSRSSTSPSLSSPRLPKRTRPLKVLIYSPDGYTESSVPALCLLMAIRGLSLPEAYLELQVVKKRSFFVYENDLGVLRRVDARLQSEREQERARIAAVSGSEAVSSSGVYPSRPGFGAAGGPVRSGSSGSSVVRQNGWSKYSSYGDDAGVGAGGSYRFHSGGRPAAYSISIPSPAQTYHNSSASASATGSFGGYHFNSNLPSSSSSPGLPPVPPPMIVPSQNHLVKSRPRASTSPWLPSLFEDHQSWFNDPRFDGSFPSRVLPFLYLGNLNHASNAYMLHALGITHVVSVGECALVPPPSHNESSSNGGSCTTRPAQGGAHFVAGKGPGREGSLWIEEREGRIKVLDIQGVCDDGIDTLEPQLEPICNWIEKARREGGQVLVHCRVGVSRSATVTIAYVMKHLNLPLVDAYLIVRSRRLSVLIQPNMRLLYNLCGWEIKLARERAGDDEEQLKYELARTLSWPYLAREVHSLNEKYLH